MSDSEVKPQVVSEGDVRMMGPGHDEDHYISVPIKPLFEVENVGGHRCLLHGTGR